MSEREVLGREVTKKERECMPTWEKTEKVPEKKKS